MTEKYSILFEDDYLIVVDKLVPIPVQRDKGRGENLQDSLSILLASRGTEATEEGTVPEPLATVEKKAKSVWLEAAHRIDRRASGIMIYAKKREVLVKLNNAFRDRRIEKHYIACVEKEPVPAEGTLLGMLLHDSRSNMSRIIPCEADKPGIQASEQGGNLVKTEEVSATPTTATRQKHEEASKCSLSYKLVGASDRYFFLDVTTETGRQHQVRAQLAAAGWPIRGDLKYGARRSCRNGLIMLHARSISFKHPVTRRRIEIVAPFPEDEPLWNVYITQIKATEESGSVASVPGSSGSVEQTSV